MTFAKHAVNNEISCVSYQDRGQDPNPPEHWLSKMSHSGIERSLVKAVCLVSNYLLTFCLLLTYGGELFKYFLPVGKLRIRRVNEWPEVSQRVIVIQSSSCNPDVRIKNYSLLYPPYEKQTSKQKQNETKKQNGILLSPTAENQTFRKNFVDILS